MDNPDSGWSSAGGGPGFEAHLQHLQMDGAPGVPQRSATPQQQQQHQHNHQEQPSLLQLLNQGQPQPQPQPSYQQQQQPPHYYPPPPHTQPQPFMQPPPGFFIPSAAPKPDAVYSDPQWQQQQQQQPQARPPYMPTAPMGQPLPASPGPLPRPPQEQQHPSAPPGDASASNGDLGLGMFQEGAMLLKLLQHSNGEAAQQQQQQPQGQADPKLQPPPGFFSAPMGALDAPGPSDHHHQQRQHQQQQQTSLGGAGHLDMGLPSSRQQGGTKAPPGFQQAAPPQDAPLPSDFLQQLQGLHMQPQQQQQQQGLGVSLDPALSMGSNYGLWSSGSGLWSSGGDGGGGGGLWGPQQPMYGAPGAPRNPSPAPGGPAPHSNAEGLLGQSLGGLLGLQPPPGLPPGLRQQPQQPPPGWSQPGGHQGPEGRVLHPQQPVGVSLGPSSSPSAPSSSPSAALPNANDLLRLLQQGQRSGGTAAFLQPAPPGPGDAPLRQQQKPQQQQQQQYSSGLPPPPPPARTQQLLDQVQQHHPKQRMSVKDRAQHNQMQRRMREKPLTRRQGRGGRGLRSSKEALTAELERLAGKLEPSAEEVATQQRCFATIVATLKKEWPHCNVHLFGSCANGLSLCNNNDLDISIELPEAHDDKELTVEAVEKMGEILEGIGMKDIKTITHARVPIVKFEHPDTATKCDITVNNELACINTKLLRDYASLDPRMRQLVFIVKHWAKRREVNEAYQGSLSSYAYVLMCIHLLQNREPPVLPCLQAIDPPTHRKTVGEHCCDYYDNLQELEGYGKPNTETLAELLWSFFEYWAWRHDYNNTVISIRTGGFFTKSNKGWTKRVGSERHLICMEDPFLIAHDLGRVVDRNTIGTLRREFERAARILQESPNPVAALLEAYQPPPKAAGSK